MVVSRFHLMGGGLAAIALVALAPSDGCQTMTCEERVDAATTYVNDVIQANLSCTSDEQCTTVWPGTECMGACQVAVNLEGAQAVEDAVAYANETWCNTYMSDGCPYATPDCLYMVAACEYKVCTLVIAE